MDDFMGFMRQASQTPLLAAALIGKSLLAVWKQLLCTGIVVGGSVVIWQKTRKKRQPSGMEWHELLAKPVPMPEPHKAPIIDEEALKTWTNKLISVSGIAFTAQQARKLYRLYLDKQTIAREAAK